MVHVGHSQFKTNLFWPTQGGAPPSKKLVYNPNNYRYNPHKP